MPAAKLVSETLRKAGEWIDSHDLSKGFLWDNTDQPNAVCARGAIFLAMDKDPRRLWLCEGDPFEDPLFRACDSKLAYLIEPTEEYCQEECVVPDWNNHPERTKEEVVKLFFQAADEALL